MKNGGMCLTDGKTLKGCILPELDVYKRQSRGYGEFVVVPSNGPFIHNVTFKNISTYGGETAYRCV